MYRSEGVCSGNFLRSWQENIGLKKGKWLLWKLQVMLESILIFKNNSFVKFIILKNVIAFKNSAGDLILDTPEISSHIYLPNYQKPMFHQSFVSTGRNVY